MKISFSNSIINLLQNKIDDKARKIEKYVDKFIVLYYIEQKNNKNETKAHLKNNTYKW
jgi:hypothetical protein